jgi:hypothetical protein
VFYTVTGSIAVIFLGLLGFVLGGIIGYSFKFDLGGVVGMFLGLFIALSLGICSYLVGENIIGDQGKILGPSSVITVLFLIVGLREEFTRKRRN